MGQDSGYRPRGDPAGLGWSTRHQEEGLRAEERRRRDKHDELGHLQKHPGRQEDDRGS
ncbi:hypothetical protein LCGC14_1101290 [marine sediment metagenome]|uniref:Uncharacterized protein n=1 Tax=marine sediment metagenome TaxID=412755 RepID=A0A0F9MX78_9ZZZZ